MADTELRQPKIVTYAMALYDLMSTEANEVTDGQVGADAKVEGVLIWQGKLIATCTRVGIPQGYYKKVVDVLRKIGSIEIVTRGRRGNTPTTILLRYPPTMELYKDAIVKSGWDGLTATPSFDTLVAEVRDIQTRLGGIDWLEIIKNLDDRVKALESEVKDLRQQPQ